MSLARSTLLVMSSRVLVLFAGLVVSVVAAHTLSKVEQGFFFTFLSLAAAQSLFELGITNLILHHLSHARATIHAAHNNEDRAAAVTQALAARRYSTRYFGRAAGLFVLAVGAGGTVFFAVSKDSMGIHWQLPWAAMVVGTALSLFNLSLNSYLEAFGELNASYRIRITATVLLIGSFSALAYLVGGLLTYPVALVISNGYALLALRRAGAGIDRVYGLAYRAAALRLNIGPEQRKMAVSAAAGYITANSLTPYAFHYFGAEVAGQVGLTMSIFSAIAAVAMARTTAEAPSYGPLIAAGNLAALQGHFKNTLRFSIAFAAMLCILAAAARHIGLIVFPQFAGRILDSAGFVVIGMLIVANAMLSVTGTVLRAFKTEQLMWPSLAAAVLVLTAQFALHLNPVYCLGLLAAFNGLVFYPYARHLLSANIKRYIS